MNTHGSDLVKISKMPYIVKRPKRIKTMSRVAVR